MKPAHAAIYRYSSPFVRPVPVRQTSLDTRDGLVLALRSPDGQHTGLGEIAPLPGLHNESLDEAFLELAATLRKKLPETGNLTLLNVSDTLEERLYPSVRTGIEMALLNLQASITGQFPKLPCGPKPATTLPLNALLFGDNETILQQAEHFYQQGYRTLKLKVNALNRADATGQIRTLDRIFGSSITLRLDSNQSFDLEAAIRFLDALPKKRIAYIEEPLSDPQKIAELFRRSGVPIALDESLWQTPDLRHALPDECLGAYILKPSRIGGIAATMKMAIEAEAKGIPAVISSGFESGISLGFYARMASLLGPNPTACGIDTFRQFTKDILITPLCTQSGSLCVESIWRRSTAPDMSRLTCIEQWTL